MFVSTSLLPVPRRLALAATVALVLGTLGACGSSSHPPGTDAGTDGSRDAARDASPDAADAGRDAARDAGPDGGDGGVACGERTCSAGQVCCPGCPGQPPLGCADSLGACPVVDCPPPDACAAMDARGVGPCEEVLGVAWNGSSCVTLSGCRCAGSDCGRLFDTLTACEEHYLDAGCIRDCRTTGCPDGSTCQLCFTSWECIPDGAIC